MTTETPADREARKLARLSAQQQRSGEARQAMLEVEAAKRAEQDKTVRLRALRLEKEKADLAATPVKPEKKRRASPARATTAAT